MRRIGLLFGSVALATVFIGPASADGETYKSFKDCRPLTNHEIRLTCYDTFADGMVFSTEKRVAAKEESFGKLDKPLKAKTEKKDIRDKKVTEDNKDKKVTEDKKDTKDTKDTKDKKSELAADYDDDTSEMELEIVKFRMNNVGTATLWAKNGQIWRQLGSNRLRAPKAPFNVVIRKNLMGGYSLHVLGRNQSIRVKRIK